MTTDERILRTVRNEIRKADECYGNFRSSHEGLGVLLEEMAELTEAVRRNSPPAIRKEAAQCAAVAFRLARAMFLKDVKERSTKRS